MKRARVVVINQARLGSTRLPGKVLLDLHGRPLLERQIERLRRARTPDEIVIATTFASHDDRLADFARSLGLRVFRGHEHDVLERYVGAAAAAAADVVVRVTSDCPLLDPTLLDRCVRLLLAEPELDYVSNTLERTYPRGLDVEALRRATLLEAHREAHERADREHVTRFVWRQPERFRLGGIKGEHDHSQLRWTVDEADDLAVVRAIYDALYPHDPTFGFEDVLRHAERHPEIHARNRHIAQKEA